MDLRGKEIKEAYKGVLNLVDNAGAQQNITSTLKRVTDGEGILSALLIASDKIVVDGLIGAGDDFIPSAKFHAKAKSAYDYLFRGTDLFGNHIFQVREGITNTESVLSKYGYMSENSGSFQIAGFGATFGGDRVHLYSGFFMRASDPSSGAAMGIGGSPGLFSAHASALLDLQSTSKGFLPPRMTASEAGGIGSPADGLIVYVTDTDGTFTSKGIWAREDGSWVKL